LTLSSLTLPTWGGLHDGELFEHPTPELRISGRDYSSLPTPVADHSRGLPQTGTDYASLPNVVIGLLPTPTVQQGRNATSGRQEGSQHHDGWTLGDVIYAGLIGEITAPQSPDGKTSSDDPHQHLLSLDVQGIPA
jgi:hypothetical protein